MVSRKLSETVQKMYADGLEDENFVMEAVKHTLGGECYKSSKRDDTINHIDFWWESPKKGLIGIDVKGRKRNKRSDKNYDDSISWIEILNVKGNPGWIYGKADYIAFRTESQIIFVKTSILREYTESKIKGKQLVFDSPQDFYIPYQRRKYGRQDMMIKVPMNDLINISDFTIDI